MPDTPLTKMEALDKAQADYRKIWCAREKAREKGVQELKEIEAEHDQKWDILIKASAALVAQNKVAVQWQKKLEKKALEDAEKVKKIAKAYKKKHNQGADND